MHPKYHNRKNQIVAKLVAYSNEIDSLPGAADAERRETLAKQFVESERKIDRTKRLASRASAVERTEPGSDFFDPELAAVWHRINGDIDEASWLVFLSVHFGQHGEDGWLLCRQIYGGMGPNPFWTWKRAVSEVGQFGDWLSSLLRTRNSPMGRFGNHRKYESLASGQSGLPLVLKSYVTWVSAAGGHGPLFQKTLAENHGPKAAFADLYRQMDAILRFGRLGKFDYLTMISKLGIADIEADATYLISATGPKRGAQLLFNDPSAAAASRRTR